MAQAMKGVTKALTKLNKKISLPGLQKVQYQYVCMYVCTDPKVMYFYYNRFSILTRSELYMVKLYKNDTLI
jgi:hypothetical protein